MNIKPFIIAAGSLSILVIIFGSGCQTKQNTSRAIPIIDCHVHFWDTNRPEPISWPRKEQTQLYRPYLPADYELASASSVVKAVVVVQSGQTIGDNQWNLDVMKENPEMYQGLVGNLSTVIGTNDFNNLFEQLCQDKAYVGYRLSGKYQDGLSDALFRDLEITAKKGKTVDFLVGGYSFADISIIAQRNPTLKIMLNHFAGVKLNGEPLKADWIKEFREIAKHPNVYCKVSALYGRFETSPAPKDLPPYQEILDLTYNTFGEDRMVYGSDWPVSNLTDNYESLVNLTKSYFDNKGQSVCEKLFYKNAIRFYGIRGLQ
jgi:L-fuconolactonase